MYLLHACIEFAKKTPITIIVAHVNHGLRGKESDLDAKFVKNIAKKLNLTYEETTLNKLPKGNLEEQCRLKRYQFLEKIRAKHKAKWILTAHHLNDNIETVLLNLTRGSFLNGLSGIQEADNQRHLLRPLINLTKETIVKEVKQQKIKFRHDKTNDDTKFSRNLLRHKVIPELKKINPGLENTLIQNIKLINEFNDFLNEHIQKWLKANFQNNAFPKPTFLKQHPTIQKQILLTIYKNIHGNTEKFNQKHLNQIMKILNQNISNKQKEFGPHHTILVKNNKIHFVSRPRPRDRLTK